jgi:5-methylcytosine-specific restriction endonuclease McrA
LPAWDGNIAKRDEAARKAASEIEKATWFAEHDAYLKTAKWLKKREVVLKRAKGICEGCGEKKATQVHHLNYDHWKDEMIWELVAICGDCHEIVHAERKTLFIRAEASEDEGS